MTGRDVSDRPIAPGDIVSVRHGEAVVVLRMIEVRGHMYFESSEGWQEPFAHARHIDDPDAYLLGLGNLESLLDEASKKLVEQQARVDAIQIAVDAAWRDCRWQPCCRCSEGAP